MAKTSPLHKACSRVITSVSANQRAYRPRSGKWRHAVRAEVLTATRRSFINYRMKYFSGESIQGLPHIRLIHHPVHFWNPELAPAERISVLVRIVALYYYLEYWWPFLAKVNTHVHVRYMSWSISLSVCRLSVTFVHPTQPIEIFGNVYAPYNTLVTWRHPGKILRRSSQGNPSVGGLNQRVLEICSDLGPFRSYISETVQDRR